jgi:hypothetical protein
MKKKIYDDRIYFNITKADKEKLKVLSKINNVSMNVLIRKLITNQLELMQNQMLIYNESLKE